MATMKPKVSRKGNQYVPQGMDRCQTPPEALYPLLPYLPKGKRIWEPAAGMGYMVASLRDDHGFDVVGTDLLDGPHRNFFTTQPECGFDLIVTNPPYTIKFQWIKRCYELGKPWALLMPTETISAAAANTLFELYGMEQIVLRPRVRFRMPNIGWKKSRPQFPTVWYTWGLNIGRDTTYATVPKHVPSVVWNTFPR